MLFRESLPIKNDGNFIAPSEANNRAADHRTFTSVPFDMFLIEAEGSVPGAILFLS